MTPEERQAIRERAEAATPGSWEKKTVPEPWAGGEVEGYWYVWQAEIPHGGGMVAEANPDNDRAQAERDADFIAHARSDIPALLDDIDRLEAEKAELQERLRDAVRAPRDR